MRRSRLVAGTAAAALLLAGGGFLIWHHGGVREFVQGEYCEARVGDRVARLELDQARYAALIAGVAVERDLPARAASIALETAFQESKITNVTYGDRDSLGLFQQRPSQGWGTAQQVQDPYYATNAFYDALVKIDGYEDMPLHEAAQAVQHSADGGAYAQHEQQARILASALTGYSDAAFTCVVDRVSLEAEREQESGLTPRAERILADVEEVFGPQATGGFAPGGVTDGHVEGSAHYEGRAIDFFFRPVDSENQRRGWALAHYLVANAARLDVETVIFDDRIWSAGRSSDGWREYDEGDGSGDPTVLRHLDHVHVDTA